MLSCTLNGLPQNANHGYQLLRRIQIKRNLEFIYALLTFFSVSKGCFKSRQIPRLWKVFRRFGLDRSTREAFQALQNFGSLKLLKMFSTTQHPANIIPELLLGQKYYIFISIKGALRRQKRGWGRGAVIIKIF